MEIEGRLGRARTDDGLTEMDSTNSAWITWETQRRNEELAAAFGCSFFCLDAKSASRISRYLKAALQTFRVLFGKKWQLVFAPCPSLILDVLVAVLKPLLGYVFVLDAHNVALIYAESRSPLVKLLARFVLRRADVVIATNQSFAVTLQRFGARTAVLPDKLPQLAPGTPPSWVSSMRRPLVTLISTFCFDEPIEEFLSAAQGMNLSLVITGNRAKAGALLRYESERLRFSGFLPRPEYDALLQTSDLLVDLTTLDDCLVCGAYEGLAAGVPLLLSDTAALRSVFSPGSIFTANTREAYRAAMMQFFEDQEGCKVKIKQRRASFAVDWNEAFAAASRIIRSRLDENKN